MMIKGASVLKDHRRTTTSQMLDVFFATLLFGIWFLVLYYKITLHSLINLCQPCHIALFVQGVGVVVGGPEGAVIGILSLPLVVGPIGALIVPALDGLDQPYEQLFFFIQHYLLLITPLFLLLRNNYCAFKLVTFRSLILANWALLILHWFIFAVRLCGIKVKAYWYDSPCDAVFFYFRHYIFQHLTDNLNNSSNFLPFFQPVNRYFGVNVNFMLCPSEGMSSAFDKLPPWLLWPSYRTIIVAGFFVLSFPICYTYIGLCKIIIFIIHLFRIKDDNSDYRSKIIENPTINNDNRCTLKNKKII